MSKGASMEEAGDIFQESIIDVYKLAQNKDFTLTCPLEAFLLLICKRKWINQAEKNKRHGVTNPVDEGYTLVASKDDEAAALYADTLEKEEMVVAMLQKISDRCREIIIGSYANKSQQQLAGELGVSYAYLRKKKSLCMAELISLVRNNKNHAA
ncbi:sigma-70 family RNA polymerase sigma factor [Niabella sp. W65]|nr:sigma-70 family RNA polymerase sigma factor [Niabella sp. W65]MCH7369202.1 sigma-70 family RNA polymerase sigma factor [Niabella sp. W65]ULT44752.1 sigma-70 family RNA polymerase sigma factor [Niabella sp. I65]